jgi:putative acetyltransferase
MQSRTLQVMQEDPHSPVSAMLIRELSAELGAIYGDDGSGAFKPDDVTGARAAFVVAYVDDTPVGCGALRPIDDATGEVKRMYVRREMRGQGISRAILSKIENLAREFGYQKLQLETGNLQTEAIRLYHTSGFTQCACYGRYEHDPRSVCFEKAL